MWGVQSCKQNVQISPKAHPFTWLFLIYINDLDIVTF